ncbi:MAG: DUF2520 domain-containing protein [Chloroflexi bacterium]|nr:DUF2520 domain-containing protein [Chloroflexota bacterium]
MTAPKLPRLGIIGAGRVGQTLGIAAYRAGYSIGAVYNRSAARARALATRTQAIVAPDIPSLVADADLVLIAVPDDAIAAVDAAGAAAWRPEMGVVHHSGLHPASILQHAAAAGALTGTLHPLQSISDTSTGIERLPGTYFGLSGHPSLMPVLQQLVHDLGGHSLIIPDEAKALYHAAAVFASNYLVTCFAQAVHIFAALGIDQPQAVQALLPLARGAVANLDQPGLPQALTGPLSRGDVGTLVSHQQALTQQLPQLLPLYQALAQASMPLVADQQQLSPESIALLTRTLSNSHPQTNS